ncbi:Putative spindle assembly checkpoint component Mad1 [Septoria linicola]|uniref:Spindle assembly checkpoint component MAD1 n=1 Tax=Septoria linicola TaxID=215465 RepID=A0A9Q9AW91_9PEZI|nr:putative spindle assembly checkpoint component Mad1 [Septoria linicola]USW56300.1 Putative spindle assembly checkpoint component Mad1 [Septoria linicola]
MARANQPTYDFLAGEQEQRQPLRETMKQSTVTRPDINNEDLRAQLRTVQYELDSIKHERELHDLHHQQELREAQSRAEADFKRAQTAESAANVATKKVEALSRDTQEERDRYANEKLQLEKKVRSLQDDNRVLRDDLEEAKADLEGAGRHRQHAFSALEQKYSTLQASVEDIQQDLSGKVAALQTAQQKLVRKETEAGELENEVLRLKAQTGDADTLAVIKKELTEQVAYIKKLEQTNREHLAELKQFRKTSKSVEVVEEEKRALEAKVRMMDDMRKELAEAQLQKRILEDEKTSWTSYLETEAADGEDLRYETPEQMAKAFLQERLERLELLNKLGSIQPELTVKDENIRTLREEKARLQTDLEEVRTSATTGATATGGDAKAKARLERQKNLLTKEVDYLRAQMKTFEAEEAEFSPEQVDEARSKRVQQLEEALDQYRGEVQTLQSELSQLEKQPAPLQTPKKRSREDDDAADERLGELQRKARTLQSDLEKLQKRNHLLEAELKASASQVKSLKESSRTRVLEFRNNPTAEAEAIKMSTLHTLRDENAALLAQLEGQANGTKVVPMSTLENIRLQLEDTKAQMKKMEKKDMRLRQIYSAKALEFREAVCSILGWKLDFMPNGRVKCTSILYPTQFYDGEEVENSIVFDGENGTMKVSGGPQSVFAGEIKEMIEFWVEGRKEIPCFLAALTLEFYDKTTRAMKL